MLRIAFMLWILGHGAEPTLRVRCYPVGSWMAKDAKPFCEELARLGTEKGTLSLVESETEAEASVRFDGYGANIPRFDSTSAACTVSAGKDTKDLEVSRKHPPRPPDMEPVYEELRAELARKAESWVWKQRKKIRG